MKRNKGSFVSNQSLCKVVAGWIKNQISICAKSSRHFGLLNNNNNYNNNAIYSAPDLNNQNRLKAWDTHV